MTDIERIHVPASPPARVQKAMPAPFRRPSINLGAPLEKRVWRNTLACDLAIGDTVPGVGRVYKVDETTYLPEGRWVIQVEGGLGNRREFSGEEQVLAFVVAQ